ncbi:TadE/TadG family type IV pilus assembly protein [Albirhodobacter sp. R86504]|uniref:TadE/TadG family type IV pilus assembly protein n=1 Tax=Albirhodobacter sp. R86504 TaxID=3093848 RepID=UPI0036705418
MIRALPSPISRLVQISRRFAREDSGAALVEFALVLPMMLLFIGLSIEGARLFWAYQATVSGVRDAARYISRAVDTDICTQGGSLSQWEAELSAIIAQARDGGTVFPAGVEVTAVSADLSCASGYQGGTTAVATVTAQLRIDYPFGGFFALVGLTLDSASTSVSDQTRIIGA